MTSSRMDSATSPDVAPAGGGGIRHHWIFAPLFAPFGISSGYVSVTLAFLLARAGLPTATVASIMALSVWPQTVKMIWAPVVDAVGRPGIWYGVGTLAVGLTILLMSLLPMTPAEVPMFIGLIVVSSVASTFVSMSTEIFMAHEVPPEMRGRASGWAQAGNLGGAGIGGGIGLLLAENVTAPWVSGAVLAAICAACWSAMRFLPRHVRASEALDYGARLREIAVNVWAVARSRVGYLALIVMLLPIGSGGVPWSAIADEWAAGGNTVAFVNGMAGGVASTVGAMAAGYVCDRMELKRAYCLFGILVGAVAVAMIFAPRTPMVFATGVLAYQAIVGMAYTGYSAIVLEAIGRKSAATSWNLMAALSNVPIAAMAMIDGEVHDRWGTDAMLFGELAIPTVAAVLFAIIVVATAPRRRAPD